MSSVIPEAVGFGFKKDENGAPNTVKAVVGVEAFLVNYIDGEGKEGVRLVFHVPNANPPANYVVQERISGTKVVTSSYDWFNKGVEKKIQERKGAAEPEPESV